VKRCDMLAVLATSVLTIAGTITVYTYLGALLAGVAGLGPKGLALVLLGYGLASAVGTWLGRSAADRWGARRTVILGGCLALLTYLARSLGSALGPARAMPVLLPAILLWGLASRGLMTAQQARLVALAPALAPVSLSLHSSAISFGSATGAALGALVIANGCSGAARGGGIQLGRAAGGARRPQRIRPKLMPVHLQSFSIGPPTPLRVTLKRGDAAVFNEGVESRLHNQQQMNAKSSFVR
jgi:predicted MFS family arabinose efflux permease